MELMQRISEEVQYILTSTYHYIAMNIPNSRLKRVFYRLRGTKIGNHVDISHGVFIEEHFPEFITIHDNVDLGPFVVIVAHDSSVKCVSSQDKLITKEVIIEQNVYIGAGAIILPGVRIGHHSIIGAGSVVTSDIPPNSVAFGSPAHVQYSVDEWLRKKEIQMR
jgi:acetyltransferase-like isoleucine patch superfamily enzyme